MKNYIIYTIKWKRKSIQLFNLDSYLYILISVLCYGVSGIVHELGHIIVEDCNIDIENKKMLLE